MHLDLHRKNKSSAWIATVRQTLAEQGQALCHLTDVINDDEYAAALMLMLGCKGHVIVSGMGKSGHVGRKIAATLASTGTPSFFIHPAEAFHGDLGMITPSDVLILISASGETDEILKLIPSLQGFDNKIIAITNNPTSTLANHANATLELNVASEACPNNLAPTTSTTVTMAIGDALAIALMHQRQFKSHDFALFHPGGSLGRRLLTRVADVMQTSVPCIDIHASFREVIHELTSGCQGMTMVKEKGKLVGIITDGDLRRFMEKHDNFAEGCAKIMMTSNPLTLNQQTMIIDAEEIMNTHRISTLLVTNNDHDVVGLIRIFD